MLLILRMSFTLTFSLFSVSYLHLTLIPALIMYLSGTFLCISILIYNYSVAKILYRSYQSMKSTLSSVNFAHSIRSNSSLLSKNRFSNLTAHSGSLVTSDEIRFAKLMILLSITFVVSWGSQMVSKIGDKILLLLNKKIRHKLQL